MYLHNFGPAVEVHAPAKLNLFLEVLGKRADGFHDLETLMTTVDTFDTLRFTASGSETELGVGCRWAYGRQAVDQKRVLPPTAPLLSAPSLVSLACT